MEFRDLATRINKLPAGLRSSSFSFLLGNVVPFVGTGRIKIETLNEAECVLTLRNKRRVRNHIGGVHAAAMALAAETATGFIVGVNMRSDALPLIKSMHIDYKKRAQGDLRARAWLSDEQKAQLRDQEKGEVMVNVEVTDTTGNAPIQCQMLWAWVPKKR